MLIWCTWCKRELPLTDLTFLGTKTGYVNTDGIEKRKTIKQYQCKDHQDCRDKVERKGKYRNDIF